MTAENGMPPDSPPPAEWQRPSIYSLIVFALCIGALAWAVRAGVAGAGEGLLAGIGAVVLYLTQGPRRVPPSLNDLRKDDDKT